MAPEGHPQAADSQECFSDPEASAMTHQPSQDQDLRTALEAADVIDKALWEESCTTAHPAYEALQTVRAALRDAPHRSVDARGTEGSYSYQCPPVSGALAASPVQAPDKAGEREGLELTEKQIDAAAEAILSRRGFGFYTDPMEGGQDAYDLSCEAREEAIAALKAAKQFIANGVEFGFIRMPESDTPDPAHDTPRLIDKALTALAPQPTGTEASRGVGAETSDQIFDRLRIEHMVREWCEPLSKGPPGANFVDGLIGVLRLRFKRIDPQYRPTSKAARAAYEAIAEARGITEDWKPRS
jgi:hypothetical protein